MNELSVLLFTTICIIIFIIEFAIYLFRLINRRPVVKIEKDAYSFYVASIDLKEPEK